MPEFKDSLENDAALKPMVDMYEEAAEHSPPFARPENPVDSLIDGVDYDTDGFPILPPDLTAITSTNLGRLFQAVEAWHEYLNSMLTEADAQASAAKEIRDISKAKIKEELKDKGYSVADRDECFRLDPRYVYANSQHLKYSVYKDRLEAVKNRMSKRFQLISREISRRSDSFDFGNRDPDKRFPRGDSYEKEGRQGEESPRHPRKF